jgi:hypothetical protein
MKRDMDLMRAMLLRVEETPYGQFWSGGIENYTHEQLYYHVQLAIETGLIEGGLLDPDGFYVRKLTYEGHEFLDAARSETMWNKAKDTLQKNAGALTLEGLKAALSLLMKHAASGMGM